MRFKTDKESITSLKNEIPNSTKPNLWNKFKANPIRILFWMGICGQKSVSLKVLVCTLFIEPAQTRVVLKQPICTQAKLSIAEGV